MEQIEVNNGGIIRNIETKLPALIQEIINMIRWEINPEKMDAIKSIQTIDTVGGFDKLRALLVKISKGEISYQKSPKGESRTHFV